MYYFAQTCIGRRRKITDKPHQTRTFKEKQKKTTTTRYTKRKYNGKNSDDDDDVRRKTHDIKCHFLCVLVNEQNNNKENEIGSFVHWIFAIETFIQFGDESNGKERRKRNKKTIL